MNSADARSPTRRFGLQTLLTVLPVLSGGLYVIGATYQEGYLAGFGVENSLFTLPPDRLLFLGLTSLISFGIVPMAYGFLTVLALIAAVLIAAVLSSFPAVQQLQTKLLVRLTVKRKWGKAAPSMMALVDKSEVLYGYAIGASAVVLALVSAAVFSSRTGGQHAEQDIKKWQEGRTRTSTVVIDGEPPIRAFQIACGQTYCAFWTGAEAQLVRHEQIKRLSTQPKASEKASVGPSSDR
ncbi:hypothetical protein [Xenophilus sp.]|uniref:hypothetical protein n=1 Tax=Xenophilus sp. TaxID=1873499 RepID=UPI0037DCEDC7